MDLRVPGAEELNGVGVVLPLVEHPGANKAKVVDLGALRRLEDKDVRSAGVRGEDRGVALPVNAQRLEVVTAEKHPVCHAVRAGREVELAAAGLLHGLDGAPQRRQVIRRAVPDRAVLSDVENRGGPWRFAALAGSMRRPHRRHCEQGQRRDRFVESELHFILPGSRALGARH